MKLVSYKVKASPYCPSRVGVIMGDRVVDLQDAYRHLLEAEGKNDLAQAIESVFPSDPSQFFAYGKVAQDKAQDAFQFIQENEGNISQLNREDVTLGQPVPNPSKVICVGTNYKDHVLEMNSEIPEIPVLFSKFNNAIIGPEDAIEKAPATSMLDYEVEFAVVIGKQASCVKRENALDYVAGYTIGNDISARDLQKRTPQWLQGKTLDRSTPIGPWIVTTDELSDPKNVNVKSYVNGELRQSSNTEHLIFDVPFLIEFISDLITLEPGDIILTGTPGGVGFAMDPPQFLQEGDVVTLEIEGIGTLENKVIAKK